MANNQRNIVYLNKSFPDFKQNLIEYAKTYFPNTYNDFTDASPGMMFIEMASYVGDVLSFYLDTQVQETLLVYAQQKENLVALAYSLGYRPQMSYASSTLLDIYQVVPSQNISGSSSPDFSFATIVPENTIITSNSTGLTFLTSDIIDFSNTGSMVISFVNSDYYLLKKSVEVVSAQIKTSTFNFGSAQKFAIADINDTSILQVLDVVDSNGEPWTEVSYLAQETIPQRVLNTSTINPNFSSSDNTPYLLQYETVPRRFVTRFIGDTTLQMQFGAGVSNSNDEEIVPNPNNVGIGLIDGISDLDKSFAPPLALTTREYGLAPSNTTLTVRYLTGGGIQANIPSNDLTIIDTSNVVFKTNTSNPSLNPTVLASIISNNSGSASGGRDGDTVEEIRQNTLHAYTSQLRAVTKDDYVNRALNMSSDFGSIAKAYITPTGIGLGSNPNPLSLDLYILAYNNNKDLVQASPLLKQNLKTYLGQYRMLTDAINIKDAFYIDLGINFDITVSSNAKSNNATILSNCILALQSFFNIDNWQINQPLLISDITSILLQVAGVQSVVKIEIINKQSGDGTYSLYGYDISGATKNNIIYPSMDPSIFEIRYPNSDIQGRVITL